MSLTKRFLPTIVLSLIALTGTTMLSKPRSVVAQLTPQAPAPTRPTSRPIDLVEAKVLEQLNLTADQKQKIDSINADYRSKLGQLMHAIQQASSEYRQAINGDTATDVQIREQYRQLQAAMQHQSEAYVERTIAIRDVLTPEQRKQRSAILNDPTKLSEIARQLTAEQRLHRIAPQPSQPQK